MPGPDVLSLHTGSIVQLLLKLLRIQQTLLTYFLMLMIVKRPKETAIFNK